MKAGLWDYVRAAFSACPMGMFLPPNWIGLGLFALLGLLTPGFWLLGAGLELAYLYLLVTNTRFQRLVDALRLTQAQRLWQGQLDAAVGRLSPSDRERFNRIQSRCRSILEQQGGDAGAGLKAQAESLGRLMWIYITLMLTRQSITRILSEVGDGGRSPLDSRLEALQKRLKDTTLGDDLRKSLTSQVQILQQRLEKQKEAAVKIAFLDAELSRIQEQVELIREQAVLTTDPEVVSQRIDQVSATLGSTTQWLRDQQQIYGKVEDLMLDPPPVPMADQVQETP
jgi:hypothetical protein